MSDTRITEPTQITTRESLAWTRTFDGYPATEWTLSYVFKGVGVGFNVAATADGDAFAVSVAGTVTQKMAAGQYQWQAWVTNIDDTSIVKMIGQGPVTVKLGFDPTSAGAVELRSANKIMLDTLDAALKQTGDLLDYEISTPSGMRRVRRQLRSEALGLRKYYAELVAREDAAERARATGKFGKTVNVRVFDNG